MLESHARGVGLSDGDVDSRERHVRFSAQQVTVTTLHPCSEACVTPRRNPDSGILTSPHLRTHARDTAQFPNPPPRNSPLQITTWHCNPPAGRVQHYVALRGQGRISRLVLLHRGSNLRLSVPHSERVLVRLCGQLSIMSGRFVPG